ncbi:hypothetical protein RVR_2246 [Actinacidiphila reveromycinica]|uniref:Uncharacterized protein n=1 Tax=Actinacidiphila reveromycinica TaxID=659352 RepID=A0A7U3UQD2_9ACTN|nr:hypothetical protein [Streptomyces sp. SN-593]BBA96787.1 hypothetical protein RVR_2246 [Streptomyces sp. SN-593]
MGYSVLYIAFGIVALWLLGEVLLQYKARLRWRVLAFAGFLGLVVGVAERSVVLILLGAVAFGTGQSMVTLSYKRGFSTGWSIGGRPGSSRRRRAAGTRPAEPVLEVGPIEPDADDPAGPQQSAEELAGVGATAVHDFSALPGDGQDGYGAEQAVYQPMPMLDDSGEYPLYDGQSTYTPDPYTSGGYEGYGAQGYQSWTGYEQQPSWEQGQHQGGQGGGYQEQPAAAAAAAASYGYDPDEYDVFGNSRGTEGSAFGGQDTGGGFGGQDTGGGFGGQDTGGGYGGQDAGGDWRFPQPYPQQPAAEPYGGYGYDQQVYDQQQAYIPQQPHQPPYEQQHGQQPQQQEEYADPYDPYRY